VTSSNRAALLSKTTRSMSEISTFENVQLGMRSVPLCFFKADRANPNAVDAKPSRFARDPRRQSGTLRIHWET
jgi:hypothetical protein